MARNEGKAMHMRDSTKRRAELADFLRTRRARLQPEQFGLPTFGRRRTPGLRRDEVAYLAGVGVSWYTWLEQGRDITVSDQVLERLAETLKLESEERNHLFVLARGLVPVMDAHTEMISPPPGIQAVLDTLSPTPAILIDHRFNLIAWNEGAVLQKHEEDHKGQNFTVLLVYLDSHSEPFGDERRLPQAISFAHFLHLSFSYHIHHLISL